MISRNIIVSGGFDDLRSQHLRFLEAASKLGQLTVLLWPDAMLEALGGSPPKFPQAERAYVLRAVRFVSHAIALSAPIDPDALPVISGAKPDVWADAFYETSETRRSFCEQNGIVYHVIDKPDLAGFPVPAPTPTTPGRKKIVVTGCYDWFHSGHVRFFEEASALGDLHVVIGHDANIRLLKGAGHPLIPQDERRYVVGSIKFVKQALVSSGSGWLDADPEIQQLAPDIYVVNEDGDKGGKREYCEQRGIEYRVLKRTPAPGLPERTSTNLRGF